MKLILAICITALSFNTSISQKTKSLSFAIGINTIEFSHKANQINYFYVSTPGTSFSLSYNLDITIKHNLDSTLSLVYRNNLFKSRHFEKTHIDGVFDYREEYWSSYKTDYLIFSPSIKYNISNCWIKIGFTNNFKILESEFRKIVFLTDVFDSDLFEKKLN